jgi:hypothetical protein
MSMTSDEIRQAAREAYARYFEARTPPDFDTAAQARAGDLDDDDAIAVAETALREGAALLTTPEQTAAEQAVSDIRADGVVIPDELAPVIEGAFLAGVNWLKERIE